MKKRLLVLGALALPASILPTAAMAQDAIDALGGVGINCSMPGSFCTSTKTTVTTNSDGTTTKTSEKTNTIGGVRIDDADAAKARKPIQPARDNSPYPGMQYDPALGYYVPNTPAPLPAAKPAPTAPETAPNSFGFGEPAIKPDN